MGKFRRVFRIPRWRRTDLMDEVDEELAFHLSQRAARLKERGLASEDAERNARELFGDVSVIREACVRESTRRARRDRVLQFILDARQDVRFAVRALLRARRLAAAVVLTLALGIGANASMYSIADAIFLRPIAGVRDVASLFELGEVVSYPVLKELQERLPRLRIAAVRESEFALGAGDRVELVTGGMVTGNFFSVVGIRTVIGRPLRASDDVPGAPPVVVLAHAYWTQSLGADPAIVGRPVIVNGASLTVVGVAAPEFRGLHLGTVPSLWVTIASWPLIAPSSMQPLDLDRRGWQWATVVGRLPAGVSWDAAHAAVSAAWRRIDPDALPEHIDDVSEPRPAQAAALPRANRDAVTRFSAILTLVVALVLLAACANIAGLLLARGAYRRREMAIRAALGAGRWRLMCHPLAESMLLALAGGVAGLAVFAGARALLARAELPGGIPGSSLELSVDGRLIVFATILSLIAGLIVGIAPAGQAARHGPMGAIKGRTDAAGSGTWLRGGLVSAQAVVALVLLVGTGLFARALGRAFAVDLGFQPERVVLVAASPSLARLHRQAMPGYFGDVVARVSAVPGVERVSWARVVPLTSAYDRESAEIEGYQPRAGEYPMFEFAGVGPLYHDVMGIRITSGRGIEERDFTSGEPVVVINETAARRYFPERDPLGSRITIFGITARVVGVARDVKYHRLNEDPRPYLYYPDPAIDDPVVVARTSEASAASIGTEIEAAVRAVHPAVPILRTGTLDTLLRRALAPQLGGAWLLGVFAVLSMVVTVVGIYGVVAFTVSQRTREIGVHMAIGARPWQVIRRIVGGSLAMIAMGIPVGLVVACLIGRAATTFLYGVAPTDVPTLLAAVSGILVVSTVAALLPARRVARIDPLVALRADH